MDKQIPFIFWNKDGPVCGAKSSIYFTDYNGKHVSSISKAWGTYDAKCEKCGEEYGIIWEVKDDKYLPSLTDKKYIIDNFVNYFVDNEKRNIDDILYSLNI